MQIDVLALSALVCSAQGDAPAALERLNTALELGIRGGNIRSFADLGVSMANLLLNLRETQADGELAGYIDQILAAFPTDVHTENRTESALIRSGDKSAENLLIQPLTRRERQVLKHLPEDISLQEIANRLSISPATEIMAGRPPFRSRP